MTAKFPVKKYRETNQNEPGRFIIFHIPVAGADIAVKCCDCSPVNKVSDDR